MMGSIAAYLPCRSVCSVGPPKTSAHHVVTCSRCSWLTLPGKNGLTRSSFSTRSQKASISRRRPSGQPARSHNDGTGVSMSRSGISDMTVRLRGTVLRRCPGAYEQDDKVVLDGSRIATSARIGPARPAADPDDRPPASGGAGSRRCEARLHAHRLDPDLPARSAVLVRAFQSCSEPRLSLCGVSSVSPSAPKRRGRAGPDAGRDQASDAGVGPSDAATAAWSVADSVASTSAGAAGGCCRVLIR